MNNARLLQSVDTLVACKDLSELATQVAQLAQASLEAADVLVLLRGPDGEFSSGQAESGSELRAWAEQLLAEPVSGLCRVARRVAARIDAAGYDVQGVVVVGLPEGAGEDERVALLGPIAALAATCSLQLQRRALTDRALQETRALVARGLHDLCTPLNSLRLGMHLLEPALTTKDPAVAQRTHRAVDRMATLVSTMAEAIDRGKLASNLRV